jgi:2-polyprenyl-6-methoxyphenol hydroxylase-like FAD-dependent oxidoreductase
VTDVIVIGGGVAGLGTALAVAGTGRTVTVLERDHIADAPDPATAFTTWARHGAPQLRHSHAFLARMRQLLRAQAPELLDDLFALGATELRFTEHRPPELQGYRPQPGDDELVGLACRRVTFEWALRCRALAHPNVTLKTGSAVTGLVAEARSGRVPHVTGVRLGTRTQAASQLVVDAAGRNSPLPAWLAAVGAPPLEEDDRDIGQLYCSRFYQEREGVSRPETPGIVGADLGYMKYGVFPADAGTFSLTLVFPTDDAALRALTRPVAFDALASSLPTMAEWLAGDRAVPMTADVAVMARLRNRLRRLVVGGQPIVTGLVCVGDSAVCTNPLYGRGTSLAMVHAFALAEVLGEAGEDPVEVTTAFAEATRAHLEPWYYAAVISDEQDRAARQARAAGDDVTAGNIAGVRDAVLRAARTDAVVWRAFVRTFNLLDPPQSILADPEVMARVNQSTCVAASPPVGPTRDETLRILAAA